MTSAEWADIEPAVRNAAFFSATVEDERLLEALFKLVEKGGEKGMSSAALVDEALQMLENISLDPVARSADTFQDSFETLYDVNRLKLIFRTQNELAHGYSQLCDELSNISLQTYPGWRFVRQPGAKEDQKRPDHVRHENAVRLKTDTAFWLARNSKEQGGFGNPYGPWGFNSWMRTEPVDRETCEKLGLIKPGERMQIPSEYSQWGIAPTVQSMGKAGVSDLPQERQDRIIHRCEDEGINVQPGDRQSLQIVPNSTNDPLNKLDDMTLEAWAEQEMQRLMQMDDDDILRELLGEEVQSAKGELQQDGTICRKDNCKKHDNSPHSDWKPIIMPQTIKPEEARAKLTRGVVINNPLGENIKLDNRLIDHWVKAGKTNDDINKRLAALPLIEEVVKNPAEIWENEKGSRTYLASFIDIHQLGKKYTIAFTQEEDNTVIKTYWPESKQIGTKRNGKKIYERADASGT
jgi:hypothetical protein